MADALLEKATSAISEAKESVTSTAETTAEAAKTSLTEAQKTVAASTETVKTEAAAAPEKVTDMSTKAKGIMDNILTRGIDGTKSLLQTFEEKRGDVSTKLVGAVTNVVQGASSSTSRDLPVSTDNQPLLASGETTPWWKNCCGVLDLLKKDTTK